MAETIKTVEEFMAWTKQVKGGAFLYRGMADASWEVESSAYRRIKESQGKPPLPFALQNYIEQLLENARMRGFHEREGKNYNDLQLLADLQHHGAATCLIDFTTNALIALWVACEERSGQPAGKVVAIATDDPGLFAVVGSHSIGNEIDTFLDKEKLWRWEPSHLSTRIVAQQSVFVFGTGTIDKRRYESIQIAGDSKGQIREELAERFGITEQYLFSDFPGFALSHGHDRPYRGYTADDYFSLAIKSHQQGDHAEAIAFYSRVLGFDPEHGSAYLNRGHCKTFLEDNRGAIEDYGRVLALDSKHVGAYYSRGLAKNILGKHTEAVEDYDRVLALDSKHVGAYRARGLAKISLKDFKGAIEDCNWALALDSKHVGAYYCRGLARVSLADNARAIEDFSQVVGLDPGHAEAYDSRASAKAALGRIDEAREDYQKALALAQEEDNEDLVARVRKSLHRLDNDEEPQS